MLMVPSGVCRVRVYRLWFRFYRLGFPHAVETASCDMKRKGFRSVVLDSSFFVANTPENLSAGVPLVKSKHLKQPQKSRMPPPLGLRWSNPNNPNPTLNPQNQIPNPQPLNSTHKTSTPTPEPPHNSSTGGPLVSPPRPLVLEVIRARNIGGHWNLSALNLEPQNLNPLPQPSNPNPKT